MKCFVLECLQPKVRYGGKFSEYLISGGWNRDILGGLPPPPPKKANYPGLSI